MRKLNNILQLGIKELRSLYRDPALLLLILYAFTLSIYSPSQQCAGVAAPGQHWRARRGSLATVDAHRRRLPVALLHQARGHRPETMDSAWTPGAIPSP